MRFHLGRKMEWARYFGGRGNFAALAKLAGRRFRPAFVTVIHCCQGWNQP